MRYFYLIFGLIAVTLVSILGVRGQKFHKPPLYIFPDMDCQAKYQPQGGNVFFDDGYNDRPVPEKVIARGQGWDRSIFTKEYEYIPGLHPEIFTGKDKNGQWLMKGPLAVTEERLREGQEKYNRSCVLCHGRSGDGNGITKQYGMSITPSYHDDRLRNMADGELFNTITHGKNQMGAYGYLFSAEERWAIVHYLRVLQRSQNGKVGDVEVQYRKDLGL